MRSRSALLLLVVASAAQFSSATYAATSRVFFSSGNLRRTYVTAYKPTYVLFGQRSTITGLRWHGWNQMTPSAQGTLEFNDCVPDCAAGHASYYTVRVTLSRIRRCRGVRQYLTMRFSYVRSRPAGAPATYRENYGRLC